jgi:hypothetical protein
MPRKTHTTGFIQMTNLGERRICSESVGADEFRPQFFRQVSLTFTIAFLALLTPRPIGSAGTLPSQIRDSFLRESALTGLSEHLHGGLTNVLARGKGKRIHPLTNLDAGTHAVHLAFGGEAIDKVAVMVKEGKNLHCPKFENKLRLAPREKLHPMTPRFWGYSSSSVQRSSTLNL